MKRHSADSTNRSLAAFQKLQHIPTPTSRETVSSDSPRRSRRTTSRFRLALHRYPGAKAPAPTAAPSAPTPLALRAPSVRANTAPFTLFDPTMPPTSFDIGFSFNPCPRKPGAP